ncbi:major facilitator superfamily domain-containing protein [Microdochium trichocladiopsis]|uniref:Major facilitator superfamily domain-containing protein n=1 Tax=Microdochium trichocladiopsis TaxID=1682393 RepID=A0A9P8Y6B8_9PEZI|nr:major facilitator superfamily domain-containing protein [Microdochium trichocladiopsis]KAH7028956.1 major facilitator superfamily domain-containing protein [Microdochium trichocladiopsis]
MSLAQHVTATEGVDREDGDADSHSKPLWRTLSYDPVPAPDAPLALQSAEPAQHTAAYKVSAVTRAAQVAIATVACVLAAGIVFGFASFKPIMIAEGVYSDLCDVSEQSGEHVPPEDHVPCARQDLRLNLFFTSASITANVSSLLAGSILDRYGRRVCYYMSAVLLAAGSTLLATAFRIPEFDGYIAGNIFLALGGTFVFVPSFQLADAFPRFSGLIVAVITGAFDASAAVFLFYRLAWEASDGAFTPARFFSYYLVVPLFILISEWLFMPRHAYHTTSELEFKIEKNQDATRDLHESDQDLSDNELTRVRSARRERRQSRLDQLEDLVGDAQEREDRAVKEEDRQVASGVWGVLHGLPAHRQMLTPWFLFILLLTVLQMLRMNYFIATVRAQYLFLLRSDEQADAVNDFFDIALPLGGIATTPFIGLLLNHFSMASVTATLTAFICAIGILNCLPYLWAGYATVVLFVIFRPLYYSAVSDYATKVFGFATFGRIYGAITCLSGLFNFSQSALDALTHGPLNGDPTPINIAMAVAGTLCGMLLTGWVVFKGREFEREVQQQQGSAPTHVGERLGLIREDTAEYGTIGMAGRG